ncbi:MAG: bifunctional histidinol-phosphatase/imidazoleglycerol-phosphate dehydratase HisB [Pseudomonadota bacterium]
MSRRILFVDRDGTLIAEPPDFQVDALEKLELVPGVIPALLQILEHGYELVMVSNQDGLGTASFPKPEFELCHEHMLAIFESQGISFAETFICPHLPEDGCDCRKPKSGLLTRYLAATDIDTERSAVVGDRETDLELAARLGVQGLMLGGDGGLSWDEIATTLCHSERRADVTRNTRETDIAVHVNLDTQGNTEVATGIGFFDHMLEQIAKHGGFTLKLRVQGDLQVDEHHTVEDTAICLGLAIRQALGDKRGIGRYGFVLPMDESEAQVSLDLSGRGAFVFNGRFPREQVGSLSTEMVEHFFRSLAESLGAALHLTVRGANTHHMVEGCFKSVGRTLRQAIREEDRELPTTKGLL